MYDLISRQLLRCVALWVLLGSFAQAETLKVYTEEFPPFNFSRQGQLEGFSVAVVSSVLELAGYEFEMFSYPWARSYKLGQGAKNAFIFSMSRQAKRETSFQWVGTITPPIYYAAYALSNRDDIEVHSLEEMKKYRIGTSIGDARETFLVSKGFDVTELHRVGGERSHLQNYRKLKANRIDLWPMPQPVMAHILKQIGEEPTEVLVPVFSFSELSSEGYYLAASNATEPGVVERIRAALDRFKKSPEYAQLLVDYGIANPQ